MVYPPKFREGGRLLKIIGRMGGVIQGGEGGAYSRERLFKVLRY